VYKASGEGRVCGVPRAIWTTKGANIWTTKGAKWHEPRERETARAWPGSR